MSQEEFAERCLAGIALEQLRARKRKRDATLAEEKAEDPKFVAALKRALVDVELERIWELSK